jgi:hypothetical protein
VTAALQLSKKTMVQPGMHARAEVALPNMSRAPASIEGTEKRMTHSRPIRHSSESWNPFAFPVAVMKK